MQVDIEEGRLHMTGEKFTLMQYSVSAILGLIDAEDFVITFLILISGYWLFYSP